MFAAGMRFHVDRNGSFTGYNMEAGFEVMGGNNLVDSKRPLDTVPASATFEYVKKKKRIERKDKKKMHGIYRRR